MLTSSLASACSNYYRDVAIAFKDAVVSFYETHIYPLMEAVATFVASATKFLTIEAIVPAGEMTPILAFPAYVLFFPAVVDAAKYVLTKCLAKIFPHFIAQHMAAHLVLHYACWQTWTLMVFGILVVVMLILILVKYLNRCLWE